MGFQYGNIGDFYWMGCGLIIDGNWFFIECLKNCQLKREIELLSVSTGSVPNFHRIIQLKIREQKNYLLDKP